MGVAVTILLWLSTLIAIGLAALYIFFKRRYSYWSERNVPHTKPSIPFGDLAGLGASKNLGEVFLELYQKNSHHKFFGFWMLHKPGIMINDLDLAKKVLIEDFSNFRDHGVYYNEKDDPLQAHLFAIGGAQWKNLRAKLSPTFTSGKMKTMFPIVADVGLKLQQILGEHAQRGEPFEAKDIIARYSTDIISSCAFGLETNSLENPDSIFRKMGKKIFEPTLEVMVKNTMSFMIPDVASLFKIVVTPKDVSKYFLQILSDTIQYREKNNTKRNDFLQLLIELKNKGFIDDVDKKGEDLNNEPFTFNQAAAQAFIFFIGGYETSSSLMQFALWELAVNQDVQEKARKEIQASLKESDGTVTYDGMQSLKYLGMILDEALRKYPPAPSLTRECNKDYVIPGTDVVIEKGLQVFIPSFGFQMDERYWNEPSKFIPERFTDEEKLKRHNLVHIPFGDGPRFCIGQRFAQMQMRVALVSILSKFRIKLGELSPRTIEFDPKSLVIAPKGGMHLYLSTL